MKSRALSWRMTRIIGALAGYGNGAAPEPGVLPLTGGAATITDVLRPPRAATASSTAVRP
jgi:hypothetical protein